MYSGIYVPLDNSEHSNAAAELAVELAVATGARCIGSHVYAARMHDYRFKQMEYTLPDEYRDETELLRQRRIHESLITTGLQLISDSYTDVMRYRCLQRGVDFEARAIDGKNWQGIVDDVSRDDSGVDLVVMGALGMGAVKESLLGSVTERTVRRLRVDSIVVRDLEALADDDDERRPILVCIDGSPQSFGGLRTAIDIGRVLDRRVEAIAVYDPYLHYAVFNGIVDVLSEKASKVFRFKEQEALHEEIIDTGLAKIYTSHLDVARSVAADAGVELTTTLLDGKAFEQILRTCRERRPFLCVLGRIGVHSDSSMDLGSATEQLLRLSPCNLLVSSRTHVPPLEVRADASTVWLPEAEERMARIPVAARGIARMAVLRWCGERGHSVVGSGDVDAAIDDLMPFQRAMRRIGEVASTIAEAERAIGEEPPVERARALCMTCGYASTAAEPVVCPVCGGGADGFERVDEALLREAAAAEGDSGETAFDGRRLGWTLEARSLLHSLPAGYLRRRVKARVEKAARTRRLPAITREVVAPFVEPELAALGGDAGPHRAPIGPALDAVPIGPRRLPWSAEAESRLERVPAGFLRSMAVEQVERLALAVGAPAVDGLHVEAGIAAARDHMHAALAADGPGSANGAPSGCPAHGGNGRTAPSAPVGCPAHGANLNEVTAGFVEALGKRATTDARERPAAPA